MKVAAVAVALAFVGLLPRALGEAPAIDHGSFGSPDGRFAFELTAAQYGYHAKITDLRAGTSTDSALSAPDPAAPNSNGREGATPIDFQTAIYRVDWTHDSKTFAVVYHVADGSAVDVFHFDGTAWHQDTVEPTPVYPKCPYVDTTGQYDHGPVIHYHGPDYIRTVFDEKAGGQTVWLSFGVETDRAHRIFSFYVCNFNYDPRTQALSRIKLRQIDIPTFRRLKAVHDYSRSPYPKAACLKRPAPN